MTARCLTSGTISSETHTPRPSATPVANPELRSPLAQLLHALNQPLTGLQCSMEVALASPRTPEQYVEGLHQGLELTERMRALVEAIREVANVGEEKNPQPETTELEHILREAFEDLAPVAEMKSVDMVLECVVPSSLEVRVGRRTMASAAFRLLESALSLADPGSVLRVETGGTPHEAGIRIQWQGGPPRPLSRSELGLLVAQAGWEQGGAAWARERIENVETVTIRLPSLGQRLSVVNP